MRISILFILAFPLVALGQIQINQTPLPSTHFGSEDAVGCIISYDKDRPLNVYLEIQINAEKGFGVVYAQSKPFQLVQGITKVDKNTLALRSKKYVNRDFGAYEHSNGFLPSMGYSVCVQLKCADDDCLRNSVLGESSTEISSCLDLYANNPTPLLLASPSDEAELKTKRPNFSWIPPMPLGTDENLSYRFTLVELRNKQSGETGIRRNRPIYQMEGLKTINLPFPGELDDLTVGSTYAWQVDAVLGRSPVQTSEVWEFTIVEEEEEVFPMPFVRLKRSDDQIYNALNELKFIYTQNGTSDQLNYALKSIHGQPLDLPLEPLYLKFGENSFMLDLRSVGLEHKAYYILEVKSDKEQIYRLKFRYFYKKELK